MSFNGKSAKDKDCSFLPWHSVEQLLQSIYDVITGLCISNQPNWQPVHFACAQGQKVVVHELIENYGVDPHTEDQVGCMVLVNLRQNLSLVCQDTSTDLLPR